jgi:ectoine hydroxylase-related dioxygenase (phytanoyl-CoA dioxygenase family)
VATTNWVDLEKQYIEKGWFVVDLPDPTPLFEMRDALQQILRDTVGDQTAVLERFQDYVQDDTVTDTHWTLANYFWDSEFSLAMGRAQLELFQRLLGRDLHIQYKPFLRFARPGRPEDNIGYHRDTQYGQSPYEIAVHIPFVDLDEQSALKVIDGSHIVSEDLYKPLAPTPSGVEKGSREHSLGHPYAPKHLQPNAGEKFSSLNMRAGQAAIFSPALFHGQVTNEGSITRVTTDLRVVNSMAPALFKRDKNAVAGYTFLSESPVSQVARRYAEVAASTQV